jgi:Zn-dependent alcohol dehydrogenase
VFLNGLARGCLPGDHPLCFARARSTALKGADVALVVGVPMDFRLGFGAAFGQETEIVAVDVAEPKLEAARGFGATDAVLAADAVVTVRELTGGDGVDFAYDAVGRAETLAQAVRMLGPSGTATLIGIPRPDSTVALPMDEDGGRRGLFPLRATVRVSHGGDQLPAEDFPRLARLALEGRLDLAGMVTRTIGLAEVEDAFADLARGVGIRSVIRLSQSSSDCTRDSTPTRSGSFERP